MFIVKRRTKELARIEHLKLAVAHSRPVDNDKGDNVFVMVGHLAKLVVT
jgi:hypothetical protein